MNILFACKVDLARSNAETVHVLQVATRLAGRGHKVTLACPKPSGRPGIPPELIHETVGKSGVARFFTGFNTTRVLTRLVIQGSFDVMYFRHAPLFDSPVRAAHAAGIPCVAEVNGYFAEDLRIQKNLWPMLIRHIVKREGTSLRSCSAVIGTTPEILELLTQQHGLLEELQFMIPNGVDETIFHPMNAGDARNSLGIDPHVPWIIFVGNLAPWQGTDILVKAMPYVRRIVPDARLFIAGGGHDRLRLARLSRRLELGASVVFGGEVKHARVPQVIAAARVCAAPFISTDVRRNPGSPLKLYEYLACQRPVVTTDTGSVGQFIRRHGGGVAVAPGDPAALARGITGFLQNPVVASRRAAEGRRSVLEHFTWKHSADAVEKVLDHVISLKKRQDMPK